MLSRGVAAHALMIAANNSVRRPRRSRWLPSGTRETTTGSASSNARIWQGKDSLSTGVFPPPPPNRVA